MSRFKSYIDPAFIDDNKNDQHITLPPQRHVTQVKTYVNMILFICYAYRLQLELMIIMINHQFPQHVIQWLID
jgi:hypothetical protein